MSDENCEFCGLAENCPNYHKGYEKGKEELLKEFLDYKENIKVKFRKFINPTYENSSLVGDYVEIRMFKEDWEEIRQSLGEKE